MLGVCGEHGRRIVGWVHGERDDLDIGEIGGLALHLAQCWLIIGHGPGQVVKKKSATHTWPSSDLLSNGWPVCAVSWKG